MTKKQTIWLDSFELTLTDITQVELAALHTLSVSVRWPHREEDWEMMLKLGHGWALQDSIGRVVGTAMWFPYGGAFMTIGMVMTTPRLQASGGAHWLMKHVMAEAEHRAIGLNATNEALRLYHRLGFNAERTVYQRSGVATAPLPAHAPVNGNLRRMLEDDLPELIRLDRMAFGASRAGLLKDLRELSDSDRVLCRDGRIVAFSFCRPFGRGHVIGPVIATCVEDAIAVIAPLVALHAGDNLRIDTRETEGAFVDFLWASGLPIYDTVTTMSLGQRWTKPLLPDKEHPHSFALASQTLG